MIRSSRAALLIAALAALAGGAEARADYDFSWGQSEDRGEFEKRMAAARQAILDSGARTHQSTNREAARSAYNKLVDALELQPDDPEANYFAAELIYHWDLPDYGGRNEWIERAIAHYSVYIDKGPPGPRLTNALFNRSILYSKRGRYETDYEADFRLALADYERQLLMFDAETSSSWRRRQRAIRLSNAAELYMGLGELDRAIDLYIESLDAVGNESLYMFGLAVALDRDGQRLRAAEVMREAISSDALDPRTRRCALDGPSVFFVPEGDKSYYLALRAEVLGKYGEARRHYQVFLRRRGNSNYAEVARRNLAALRKKRDTYKPSGKPCR